MGYIHKDLYNEPEYFGLELVGELELSPPSYSFDILIALYDPLTREFYIAVDSGCSCPSPFEKHTSRDTADGPYTSHQAVHAVTQAASASWGTPDDPSDLIAAIMRRT